MSTLDSAASKTTDASHAGSHVENPDRDRFASDLRHGLSAKGLKEIPSTWLYDQLGSALFEAITLLPEYGLTNADARLIEKHAADIVEEMGPHTNLVELGSGSGRKTRTLLEAFLRHGATSYFPIDVSESALEACSRELEDLGGLDFRAIAASYLDGLAQATSHRMNGASCLVIFLGSTIGNFDRDGARDFLREVRKRLAPGDGFLLGADLEKPARQLELAYDDPVGVTAAFNKNVLARANRELGADFDLDAFEHQAIYDTGQRRIEMRLISQKTQAVNVAESGIRVEFTEGEMIRTELSHKFNEPELHQIAVDAGYEVNKIWIDETWPFAETLLRVP
jgi:dimethylhistidine N-methyltransferase